MSVNTGQRQGDLDQISNELTTIANDANQTMDDASELVDQITELQRELHTIRNDAASLSGEAYGDFFIRLVGVVTSSIPGLPAPIKYALEKLAWLIAKIIEAATDFGLTEARNRFWRMNGGDFGKPNMTDEEEARRFAKEAGSTKLIQAYLMIWWHQGMPKEGLKKPKPPSGVEDKRGWRSLWEEFRKLFAVVGIGIVVIGIVLMTTTGDGSDSVGNVTDQQLVGGSPPPAVARPPRNPAVDDRTLVSANPPAPEPTETVRSETEVGAVTAEQPDSYDAADTQPAQPQPDPMAHLIGTHTYEVEYGNPTGGCGYTGFGDTIVLTLAEGGRATLAQAQHMSVGTWRVVDGRVHVELALNTDQPETYVLEVSEEGNTLSGINTYTNAAGCESTFSVDGGRTDLEAEHQSSEDIAAAGSSTPIVVEVDGVATTGSATLDVAVPTGN